MTGVGASQKEELSENQSSFSDVPGVKSQGEKYAMVYTCTVCNTRSVKQISKQGYHHGCVLVRCPGCQNLHLIADHLGIFESKGWTIESYLAENGENVRKVDDGGVLELTREDILGSKPKTTD
jgi:mitochondrial protein import protein ZIM17